jgi:hypothetical protein
MLYFSTSRAPWRRTCRYRSHSCNWNLAVVGSEYLEDFAVDSHLQLFANEGEVFLMILMMAKQRMIKKDREISAWLGGPPNTQAYVLSIGSAFT